MQNTFVKFGRLLRALPPQLKEVVDICSPVLKKTRTTEILFKRPFLLKRDLKEILIEQTFHQF